MQPYLFENARDALIFAFHFSSQAFNPSPMLKVVPNAKKEGKGLGGLDGAAQAGIIRAHVSRLGRLNEALLFARFAPHTLPITTKQDQASKIALNPEWTKSLMVIAKHLEKIVLKKSAVDFIRCWDYLQLYYKGPKVKSFKEIHEANTHLTHSAIKGQYLRTLYFLRGYAKKGAWVLGAEDRAFLAIENSLKEVQLISNE